MQQQFFILFAQAADVNRGGGPQQVIDVNAAELVIKPECAMAKLLKESDHEGIFNAESRTTEIHQLEPERDLFLVGHRDEERPNLFDDRLRFSVTFFAVHALGKGTPEPRMLMVSNGDAKTEHLQSLTVVPSAWKHLHIFLAGATVAILHFDGRTTKR